MGHRRNGSECESIFPNPFKIKSKPHPLSIPPCFASCFAAETSDDRSTYQARALATCRPDPKPKSRFGRRRPHSADFHYDPLSYALNFDDGVAAEAEVETTTNREFRHRNFPNRPPTSPPPDIRPSSVNREENC